jgi:hypothetical protein
MDDGASANRYIVKFKDGSNNLNRSRELYPTLESLPRINAEVMLLDTIEDVHAMEEREDVEYVERDLKRYLLQTTYTESVPYGVNLVKALDVSDEFSFRKKVCIIDTGYDINHEDLPKASTGASVTGASSGNLIWTQDGNGHGTHVAGTIAAIQGNNRGVVGVNRSGNVNLHIVRVFDNNGNFIWTSGLVSAAQNCVDNGSDIISMSLGGSGYSSTENTTFKKMFEEKNVLIVAAAGNSGNSQYSYPASYDAVISVAAIDGNKNRASFSQYNNQVDIAAPGVGVWSTTPGNTYRAFSGTSMATPHVSGVAALIWGHAPSRTAKDIRHALESSAQDLGTSGKDNFYGMGLLRADLALEILKDTEPTASPTEERLCIDDPVGFYDSEGDVFDCDWYASSNRCNIHGSNYGNAIFGGKTAKQACCICGGGRMVGGSQPTPTMSPITLAPTMQSTGCIDKPEGWHDSDGPSFTCLWYGMGNNCQNFGDRYERLGVTANEACCTCGGGTKTSMVPTRAPTKKSPGPCADYPGWHDADGSIFDCAWYSEGTRCEVFGNIWIGAGGLTAQEACCACQ